MISISYLLYQVLISFPPLHNMLVAQKIGTSQAGLFDPNNSVTLLEENGI